MLVKLRAVMVISSLAAWPFAHSRSESLIGGIVLMTAWSGLIFWSVQRIPRRYRGYVLGVIRRRRRAGLAATAICCCVLGVVIGPLAGLVSPRLGLEVCLIAGLSAWADVFRLGRARWKKE